MKVKNVNGTSDNTCTCGSWLAHWKKFSGKEVPKYCAEVKCTNAPEVGAHIQKDSTVDNNWYIIPMCKTHNAKATELTISDSTILVSANVSQTCGKK